MKRKMTLRRPLSLLLSVVLLLTSVFFLFSCDEKPSQDGTADSSDTAESTAPETPGETTAGTPKKRVALTFDDGPQHYEERTKAIVDELGKYGYTATFFIVGNRVPGGDALQYAVDHGCELGIHGYTHEYYYDTCSDTQYADEIEKTAEAIRKAVPGYDIRLMRPVGGRISAERLAASPYSIILWSVDSADWQYKYSAGDSDAVAGTKVNTIVDNIMNSVRDGDVILMHDIYESTYDATVILLQRLYEEGYEVVTVSELFGETLMPGQKYSRAS